MVLPATNRRLEPAAGQTPALTLGDAAIAGTDRRPVWGRVIEPYAAAIVLDDLLICEHVEPACIRVLARYAVTRCVLLGLSGSLDRITLRVETAIARAHLARIPTGDPERVVLRRLLAAAREARPAARLVRYALLAAEAAARKGHEAGAFRLYHLGFMLALSAGRRRRAATIARTMAGHAERAGAARAAFDWRQRARLLTPA